MEKRAYLIFLFLLVQSQVIFCITNDFSLNEKYDKDFLYSEGVKYIYGKKTPTNHLMALRYLTAAAEMGHTDACHKVGWLYDCSSTISQDIDKAILWYEKSSAMGLTKSMYNLGHIYHYTKGYRDYQKAEKWYQKAIDKNYVPALYSTASLMKKMGEYDLAEYYYLRAAKKGYARAEAEMGFRYEQRIFGRDYKKAMMWYQKAAAQTNARGIYGVGLMYEAGKGVKKDVIKARKLYQKAADLGWIHAQVDLGLMFYNGDGGLTQNIDKAIHYYKLAIAQKSLISHFNLALCYQKRNQTNKAFKLCYKAAPLGSSSAQAKLAYYYETGYGTTQSFEKAFYWYSKSAKQGYSYGLSGLGLLYEKGYAVEKNLLKAAVYYLRAALKGNNSFAVEKIGWLIMLIVSAGTIIIAIPVTIVGIFYAILTRKKFKKYKSWTIVDAVVLIVITIASQMIFSGLFFASSKIYDKSVQLAIILAITAVANIAIVCLAVFTAWCRDWIISFRFRLRKIKFWRLIKWCACALIISYIFSLLYGLLIIGLGIEIPPDILREFLPDKISPLLATEMIVVVAIIAPIAEEIIFRGVLYRALRQRFSLRTSLLLSSALFGIIHFDIYRFIPLMFMGIIMAYLLEKTRSIYSSILFHIANNLFAVVAVIISTNLNLNL